MDPPPPGQYNWRWCNKCQELCFAGERLGNCTDGGAHDHSSSGNVLGQGQGNWKWCSKCQAMCFAGNASTSPCPNGGVHDHGGSGDYTVQLQYQPVSEG